MLQGSVFRYPKIRSEALTSAVSFPLQCRKASKILYQTTLPDAYLTSPLSASAIQVLPSTQVEDRVLAEIKSRDARNIQRLANESIDPTRKTELILL
ncbi:uncharacterized protein UDID_17484 [Ustilago sp. UG-2017a]|nr:uncharacterized protein UDID_17484 [Ustilago sp. UG-2017a]